MDSKEVSQFFIEEKKSYLSNKTIRFKEHRQFLKWLKNHDLIFENEDEKKVFWINVYNAMTNYLIITKNISESMKEDPGFFSKKVLTIGENNFSLDDIEHGILRKNARNHLCFNDKLLIHQVLQLDYRIHFVLNCGGQSCPILKAYDSGDIDQQLNEAERTFSSENFLVDNILNEIHCSPIYQWYKHDFKGKYLDDSSYQTYKITLSPYHWMI